MATFVHPPSKDDVVFEPEATRALALAFDQVCAALDVPPMADRDRRVIATRIVDLGREGVLDPGVLRDRVLLEAGYITTPDTPAHEQGP
jgi:hypothetical protein